MSDVGLHDRDYMKRTPEELRRDYGLGDRSRVTISPEAVVWIIVLGVALYVLRRIGVPLP